MARQVDYVVVGALARVEQTQRDRTIAALNALTDVSTFEVAETERLGILIEADGIRAAHARLVDEVSKVPGVLGVWPISMEMDGPGLPDRLEPSTNSAASTRRDSE